MSQTAKRQRTYVGDRTIDGIVVTVDGSELPQRTDISLLSADGFEWGYEGPPSAQLALAILVDHFGDGARALAAHELFMRNVVANFANEWVMTTDDIEAALQVLGVQAAEVR